MRVVVADDSVLLREGVVRVLEDDGFEVVGQAGDAEDLLRKVGAHAPDVAVVDIRMPPNLTDDGLQAARQIRREFPGTGVLVLSQYLEESYALELVADSAEGVGYLLKDRISPAGTLVAQAGWLNDIADYHAIYAGQQRHLVEVGADESDHLKKWLGANVGVVFSIPDLTGFGLTFEGGRLLVANGKPVGQLMYRQADGTVIALCLQSSPNGDTASPPALKQQTIKGFDFVSWKGNGAAYVVVGPGGQPDLAGIAAQAAREI